MSRINIYLFRFFRGMILRLLAFNRLMLTYTFYSKKYLQQMVHFSHICYGPPFPQFAAVCSRWDQHQFRSSIIATEQFRDSKKFVLYTEQRCINLIWRSAQPVVRRALCREEIDRCKLDLAKSTSLYARHRMGGA